MTPPLDSSLTQAASTASSYREITLGVRSTGFRTNSLRHATLTHGNDRRIADEFLVNTRLIRDDRQTEASVMEYLSDPASVMLSMHGRDTDRGTREIPLPTGARLRLELGEALHRRRSVRAYTGDRMTLSQVASLLRAAGGATVEVGVTAGEDSEVSLRFRSVPSGGGLYPVDLHLLALGIDGVERGFYRYDSVTDSLVQLGDGSRVDAFLGCLAVPEELIAVRQAAMVLLLVGHPWRSMRKYGDRGMRFVFHEAGAISEHAHLAAVALGLASVDCASFYDDEAHEALSYDGVYQALVHMIVVGWPG
jgi:SagB-type dehydrogenase family enzyme